MIWYDLEMGIWFLKFPQIFNKPTESPMGFRIRAQWHVGFWVCALFWRFWNKDAMFTASICMFASSPNMFQLPQLERKKGAPKCQLLVQFWKLHDCSWIALEKCFLTIGSVPWNARKSDLISACNSASRASCFMPCPRSVGLKSLHSLPVALNIAQYSRVTVVERQLQFIVQLGELLVNVRDGVRKHTAPPS